jgi:tRNA threonylcarbamoyladenosine biosynthesis protein TsaB
MSAEPLALAIEASTGIGGVALGRGDAVLAEVLLGDPTRHSATLLPALEFALHHAGIPVRAVDTIVVGAGPGSFTGVRVAAATAKGLATALGLPLYAESSLAALACAAGVRDRAVCALFDARRNEVYAAGYRVREHHVETLFEPYACSVNEALAAAAELGAVCVGEGARVHADAVREAGLELIDGGRTVPRPAALLRLVRLRGGAAAAIDAAHWEPLYLRASGAERIRS